MHVTINGFTENELALAIRQERLALTKERIALLSYVRRLVEVDDRLAELDHAEDLLQNGFG